MGGNVTGDAGEMISRERAEADVTLLARRLPVVPGVGVVPRLRAGRASALPRG